MSEPESPYERIAALCVALCGLVYLAACVAGRITMPQGAVNASWSRNPSAGTYTAHLASPGGTTGRIGVPKFGGSGVTVTVNGAVVWSGGTFTPRPGIGGGTQDDKYIYLTTHTVFQRRVKSRRVVVPVEDQLPVLKAALRRSVAVVPIEEGRSDIRA